MKRSIARHCPDCKQYGEVEVKPGDEIACPQCAHPWGNIAKLENVFEYCPVCRCRQFYLSKDFNQFIGCLIMVIGMVLVPLTYGLSLPVFALIDWILFKRVATVINCYRCGSEFRHFKTTKPFKPFVHQIGLKYDKYR
jgi:ribosomal protein S27E